MSSAQSIGQWLGIVIISVTVGAIGFGFLQIALSIRDYFRRRSFYIEAGRVMGERMRRVLDSHQTANIVIQPARRGGKAEAAQLVVEEYRTAGGTVYGFEPPPFELQRPNYWSKHPGEFIIGERLRWESRIMDGDNGPSHVEPRGIFGQ